MRIAIAWALFAVVLAGCGGGAVQEGRTTITSTAGMKFDSAETPPPK